MDNETRLAYSEMADIMQKINAKLVEKVPIKLRNLFVFNKLPNYENHIDMSKPLEAQNLSKRTKCILAFINYKYWATSQEHKTELMQKYSNNN